MGLFLGKSMDLYKIINPYIFPEIYQTYKKWLNLQLSYFQIWQLEIANIIQVTELYFLIFCQTEYISLYILYYPF